MSQHRINYVPPKERYACALERPRSRLAQILSRSAEGVMRTDADDDLIFSIKAGVLFTLAGCIAVLTFFFAL